MSMYDDKSLRDAVLGKSPVPAPPYSPPIVTITADQIEAIAEAVANRVVAKLRAEPK